MAERLLSRENWQSALTHSLRDLGTGADASRAYVFEFHAGTDGSLLASQRFEWVVDGITPQIHQTELRDLPMVSAGFGRWLTLLEKDCVVAGHIQEFPPSEQALLRPQGIHSLVVVPIQCNGRLWGFLGFDECRSERIWSELEIGVLHTAARILGAAIERHQLNDQLRYGQSRMDLAMRIAKIAYWRYDFHTGKIEWSDGHEKLYGIRKEDFTGTLEAVRQCVHPEDRAQSEINLREAMEKRCPIDHTYRVIHPNGDIHWLHSWGQIGFGKDGVSNHIFGITQDITERKVAERALADEEARRRILIEQSRDGIVVLDQEGRVHESNKAFAEMLGYSPQEMGALRVFDWEFQHPKEQILEMIRSVDETGDHFETKHRRKDGSTCDVEISTNAAFFGDRKLIFCVCRDISRRIAAEKSLRESEERFRNMFEWHGAVMLLIDPTDGRIIDANKAASAFYGWDLETLRQMRIQQINQLQPDEVQQRMVQTLEQRQIHANFPHRIASGETRTVEVFSTRFDTAHRPLLFSIIYDVTEKVRAQQENEKLQAQLLQAQKMESVGRLAGGVAHDFNNMLQAILSAADLALPDLPRDSTTRECLQEIQTCAKHSAELTQQLLAFARKQTISPKVLDLNETVAGMLKMLRRLIGEDIELLWSPGKNLDLVNMDPSQVDQILANLCVNARDAIGSAIGRVSIETSNAMVDSAFVIDHPEAQIGEYVRLAVSDNGAGMTPETRAHLFEPFFTTKKLGQGTGLGLATIYGIVRQNNGFIRVSSAQNRGTTFEIFLPRHSGREAPSEQNASVPSLGGGNETILLVEDEASILRGLQLVLGKLGYRVLGARTPREAFQLANNHRDDIHLLLTDLVMPEMNGRELANKLLTQFPNLKFIFMSGYAADTIAQRGVLDPNLRYLSKPFSAHTLANAVRETLDS